MPQQLTGRTVLITGANRGLGAEFVTQALDGGAARVYAAARRPHEIDDRRVTPVRLDLHDSASIAAAARAAADTDLLVNNAGVVFDQDTTLLRGDEEVARATFETNWFGTLRVARAFAPVLRANGGGAMLNVLSLAAWIPVTSAYAASKAAMWSTTGALRAELADQGTTVTGLLVGLIDTGMAAGIELPKAGAHGVVERAYAGAVAGAPEVLADDDTRWVKSMLSLPAEEFEQAVAQYGDTARRAVAARSS